MFKKDVLKVIQTVALSLIPPIVSFLLAPIKTKIDQFPWRQRTPACLLLKSRQQSTHTLNTFWQRAHLVCFAFRFRALSSVQHRSRRHFCFPIQAKVMLLGKERESEFFFISLLIDHDRHSDRRADRHWRVVGNDGEKTNLFPCLFLSPQ